MTSLTNLPDELLLQVFVDAYSLDEIRALGLVCRRFYDILLTLHYHELCRFLHILSSDSIPSVAFAQQLASSSEVTSTTRLISQSIADDLYSDHTLLLLSMPRTNDPNKNPSIVKGCGDRLAKEILASHVGDRGDHDVGRRLKRASSLITCGDWDDRFTKIAERASLRLTRKHRAEAVYYTLSTLHQCHKKHGSSYDLTPTRDSMYTALEYDGVNPMNHYWRIYLRGLNLT